MKIKLPIPIFHHGQIYDYIETVQPRSGIIADTQRVAANGDKFGAVFTFISGCAISITTESGQEVSDKVALKSALRSIPYRSAEYVLIRIMSELWDDDGIEGVYRCPRCHAQIITERRKEGDEIVFDTRDFVKDLPVNYLEQPYSPYLSHSFSTPVRIINSGTGEVVEEIRSIDVKHPTLAHCIQAQQRNSALDDIKMQYAIYAEALDKVNGVTVENKWRNMYGALMWDNIPDIKNDLKVFTEKVNFYGIERRVEKTCPECKKIFKATVNTSNFFDFDLRAM